MAKLFSAKAAVKIALVAGEASGDLLGSHLILALRQVLPQAEFVGIGGPRMKATGMQIIAPMEKLAVNGYIEVLKHLPELLRLRRTVRDALLADRPDVFIGIDAPDFNLGLEAALKRKGIRTVHYVSPSIWAWRPERIKSISKSVSHILALFPFEPAIYQHAGVAVTYVGHPMADSIPLEPDRAEMREQMRLPPTARIVALLPGSRQSEVARHADLFVLTAQLIAKQLPGCQFLVPLVSRQTRECFETALYRNKAEGLAVRMMFGHAQDAVTAADVVLVASGTATLETALLKRPMVITYKVSPITYRIMKRKALQPWVGLPNVLAGEFVVPEILQDDATPQTLSQALLNLLQAPKVCERLTRKFEEIHHSLRQNTAHKAAQAILGVLGRSAA